MTNQSLRNPTHLDLLVKEFKSTVLNMFKEITETMGKELKKIVK